MQADQHQLTRSKLSDGDPSSPSLPTRMKLTFSIQAFQMHASVEQPRDGTKWSASFQRRPMVLRNVLLCTLLGSTFEAIVDRAISKDFPGSNQAKEELDVLMEMHILHLGLQDLQASAEHRNVISLTVKSPQARGPDQK